MASMLTPVDADANQATAPPPQLLDVDSESTAKKLCSVRLEAVTALDIEGEHAVRFQRRRQVNSESAGDMVVAYPRVAECLADAQLRPLGVRAFRRDRRQRVDRTGDFAVGETESTMAV